ncbi:MAG: biotin/lipoyl-binding protein [Bacteroidia bacterium]|nr:biotin/lipoyl-binding protein [Bacteroidia bacterium]
MTEAFIEDFVFQITKKAGETQLNSSPFSPQITRINEQLFKVNHEGKSYDVFIQKVDAGEKFVELSINGKRSKVKVVSRIEKLLKELGMDHQLAKKLDSLKAPMPGLIHSLQVEEGQEVKKGDPLLILEAMKMENVIKSPGEGTVSKIHVSPKESVEKGHVLISFA